MPRRLRLPSSSDEDEDSGDGVQNQETGRRNPNRGGAEQRKHARASRRLQILDSPEGGEEDETRGGWPVDPPLEPPPVAASSRENCTVEISDDDEFIDVQDFFTPPSSSPSRAQDDPGGGSTGISAETAVLEEESGDCPVARVLRGIGARPGREWLDSCIRELTDSQSGFPTLSVQEQADLCLKHYLFADMNSAGAGGLPPNIHMMHGVEIGGPFILQVDEIVNVGSPLRDRYKEAPATSKRCLKLSMTDGVQRVFGIEYRPIKDLKVLAPAGLKVAVHNVHIRRGLLLLVMEVLEVLGGSVEYLDAARRRLVDEVNKPPRGRRRRRGEEVASLVERAPVAAWPANLFSGLPPPDPNLSEHLNLASSTSSQAVSLSTTARNDQQRGSQASMSRSAAENIISNQFPNFRTSVDRSVDHGIDQANVMHGSEAEFVHLAKQAHLATSRPDQVEGSSISDTIAIEHQDPVQPSHQGTFVTTDVNDEKIVTDDFSSRSVSWSRISETSPDVIATEDSAHAEKEMNQPQTGRRLQVADHLSRQACLPAQSADRLDFSSPLQDPILLQHAYPQQRDQESVSATTRANEIAAGELGVSHKHAGPSSKNHVDKSYFTAAESKSTLEPATYVETRTELADKVDHPYILKEEEEVPFTYMACLQAKHAIKKAHGNAKDTTLSTRGHIKCFLTGVKGFQFKGRNQFELRVYVDDGSLISEVLIDHSVVQNGIGYSTTDVTAALSSSDKDRVAKMKDLMKRFQTFLAKFEGTMLMMINETTPVPVALEMNQGCPSSDAWMLLRRLKLYNDPRSARCVSVPISISP